MARRLVIVSNRTPPVRERSQLAGGLAVGLRDALIDRDALWFGWSGTTRRGDARTEPRIARAGRITFATLDLAEADYRGYYQRFSNGALWPVLHGRLGLLEFSRDDLAAYRKVNDIFAAGLAPLLRPDDLIWVHDYHLFFLGEALRRQGVGMRLGFFLHVPFPPPSLFMALPGSDALLRALAGYDVIGLQTREDVAYLNQAFAEAGLEARAAAFPIGIDPDGFAETARKEAGGDEAERLRASLGERQLIIGVDRLDYTKGLLQRFRGYRQLLRRFSEHHNLVTFMQVAPVSRGDVAQYRTLRRELDELAGRINGDQAEFDWAPLRYITRAINRDTLAGFYRQARIGLVTPLRDGMNLVAKEYVAAQDPEDPGVLVLSRFAGAAAALEGALLVNPYDADETAEALHQALTMPLEERRSRWQSMNSANHQDTAATWARSFLAALEQDPG